MLTYGDGPTGSFELRAGLAGFWNSNFSPKEKVSRDHVTVMGGGSSILDALSYCIAEEDEGILVAQPFYVGFIGDLDDRARCVMFYQLLFQSPEISYANREIEE